MSKEAGSGIKLKGCGLCNRETNCIEFGNHRWELTPYYLTEVWEPIKVCLQRQGIESLPLRKGSVLIYKRPGLGVKLREVISSYIPRIKDSPAEQLRT
ncbi:MAG: hypothetical protein A2152_02035 [Candidatus Levybacteria bacterium RBG_16_35_6]|nr:MAG: hypothetical protein A2152_02035 [Candidatus Levybacteria bacterium RBG_16_35_6]